MRDSQSRALAISTSISQWTEKLFLLVAVGCYLP
jgi:hypothetical protein